MLPPKRFQFGPSLRAPIPTKAPPPPERRRAWPVIIPSPFSGGSQQFVSSPNAVGYTLVFSARLEDMRSSFFGREPDSWQSRKHFLLCPPPRIQVLGNAGISNLTFRQPNDFLFPRPDTTIVEHGTLLPFPARHFLFIFSSSLVFRRPSSLSLPREIWPLSNDGLAGLQLGLIGVA